MLLVINDNPANFCLFPALAEGAASWGCRFGFVKFKARASAAEALEKLAGKQLKDFPNQAVRCWPSSALRELHHGP